MLKSLLSLVTSKDKKKPSTVRKTSTSHAADSSFVSAGGDVSILNDTSVTMGDTSFVSCTSRPRGDSSFLSFTISKGRKNRTASFDFCLSPEPKKEDVVVRRRSLQPRTPTPSPSDSSFYESIFDSPIQQNRLHSVIGDKIYEVPSPGRAVSKKL